MDLLVSIAILILVGLSIGLNLYLIRKVRWLIRMNTHLSQSVDRKFRHHFRQYQFLQALQQNLGLANSLPPAGGKAASPDVLKLLADHVLREKPEVVVECGSGLSTVVVSRCLQLNGKGHLFSLEHIWEFAARTRKELERHGLLEWASVLDAPLKPYEIQGQTYHWYECTGLLDSLDDIDLLVVDGPPARTGTKPRYPAGPLLFPKLSSSGTIIVDDAVRPEELEVIERWRKEFSTLEFRTDTEEFEKGVCIVTRPRNAVCDRLRDTDASTTQEVDAGSLVKS